MTNTATQLIIAYEALLQIRLTDEWRAEHQAFYAMLRDAIAEKLHCEPQFIQETFEDMTIIKMNAK